ncbi:Formate/glycerate dehydrogenase catalytic domain-like protein [Dothidotthia symphoricarpi CBS 119687]|uniref:Saccharopine dehydrogenase [NAD(+), L-lysine-forming] n=1 Tax=Dothidotthia symphoricarpi CBS 119687 TaxID=1392245 RepID=A0A6A6A9H0_9PLEO|nr:Formate/glycerate dehydrogenase catalytic domain-like protein [Dothidotthia symphoricarpi CBS 119687]KAF2127843.1 Formate/glycerate dehydrogenase catalytic domain-like protein [Dothidotthia symphoricarpi CBS 119687]
MTYPTLHARAEAKLFEHRSCLTPTTVKKLLAAGYPVLVERSSTNPDLDRIFKDEEFEQAGATLVDEGSWKNAPNDRIIIGLKELPEEEHPLEHTFVHFAHCYKQQGGWETVLARFPRGGGVLYDLEFLQDESGRRVAAFGYHAGFVGAALAIKTWAWQLTHPNGEPLPGIETFTDGRGYYNNETELLTQLKEDVAAGEKISGHKPTSLVLGALGRCGSGAVDLLEKIGCPEIKKWDLPETKSRDGPYPEILESDIFVNCIYLSKPIPPFVDQKSLQKEGRKLSVVCDVSCDTTNPHNPIPIYNINTTFDKPTVEVKVEGNGPRLSVISIDHLPSALPRESSEAFSNALLPSLMGLKDRDSTPVWQGAEKLFTEKVHTLPGGVPKKEV